MQEVRNFYSSMITHKPFINSTHNVLVYRLQDDSNSAINEGYNDDGENNAGKHILSFDQKSESI